MVHEGEFKKHAVLGWMLDEEDMIKLFLHEQNWDADKIEGMTKEKFLRGELYEKYYGWCRDELYGGDHDQDKAYGVDTGMVLSDVTMREWDTMDELFRFGNDALKMKEDQDLRKKLNEKPLVQKHPEFFKEEPDIYLMNNDCLCCS